MGLRFGYRTAAIAAAAAMSVGALITTAGSASADDYVPIVGPHSVGLYDEPNTESDSGWAPVGPGGEIIAQCWTVGESIGNYGDTWYRTHNVYRTDGSGWTLMGVNSYVFAGYADGNAHSVNRDPDIPQC